MNIVTMPETSGITLTPKGERHLRDNPLALPGRPGASPADVPSQPARRAHRRAHDAPGHRSDEIRAMIERLVAIQERAGALLEAMIDELDALDGDPDLEPYLAGSRLSLALDLEEDSEEDENNADDEPSLGSIERHPSSYPAWSARDRSGDQTHWADGQTFPVDAELDAGSDVEELGVVIRGGSELPA